MHVTGRCHCGAIAFTAEVDAADVSACHCTDCQVLSGSPFRVSVRAPRSSFQLLSGTPRSYVKTADSGARRLQAFCGECGTPIYACAISDPPNYSLRVGCLDERATLVPRRQIWCRSALPWAQALAAVPGTDRQ